LAELLALVAYPLFINALPLLPIRPVLVYRSIASASKSRAFSDQSDPFWS